MFFLRVQNSLLTTGSGGEWPLSIDPPNQEKRKIEILSMNSISPKGLERFTNEKYEVSDQARSHDAILVRSTPVKKEHLVPELKAIARAGAGVDKICVADCTLHGIPVFNTPGANANSVKELVMLALLLSSRGVIKGIRFTEQLAEKNDDPTVLAKQIEKEKKQFIGNEILGNTLGIVGLGAIGSKVAETAVTMGMNVIGYDPALSVESACRLTNKLQLMEDLPSLLGRSDYITLHLPMLETTKYMINAESLSFVKKGARLLNFSREEIIDPYAVTEALDSKTLSCFVTDFPHPVLMSRDDTILMPHIGASTVEAEENCATMAADQLIDYLENGNIRNSVNFPELTLERSSRYRIAISNKNIPNMLGQVLALLADCDINILDMLNKSRGDLGYTLIDVDKTLPDKVLLKISEIEGIYSVFMP